MNLIRLRERAQSHIRFCLRLRLRNWWWSRRLRGCIACRRIILRFQLLRRRNAQHGNLRRWSRLSVHRIALATSLRAGDGNQFARGQKEFARLRHDQSFAGKLLLQTNGAVGRQHAERIIHIESRGNVARGSANIQGRGDNCGRKNAQRSAGGNLQMDAPEIQRQSDRSAGLQEREFGWSANICLTATGERQARFAIVYCYHAAVEYESRAGRCAARGGSAFHRDIISFHATNRALRRLLRTRRCTAKKYRQQQSENRKNTALPKGRTAARELGLGAHRDLHQIPLYYTAVDTDAKLTASGGGPTGNAQFDTSPRNLSRWRRMQIPVIAWFVFWAIRLIGPTMRVDLVGARNAVLIEKKGEAGIGAFWHRCIFSAAWIWRNRGYVVMNTVNFDGQWTRRVIERLGFGTAQGSSSRGAIEGLTVMAQCLKDGKHVALTIDGPRGPRYVAKPGAVILARRMGSPIEVFHIGLERAYTFKKSWDQFQIPFPFTRAVMFLAPVVRVPVDAGSDVLHEKQAEVQAALERVRDAAESWFHLSVAEQKEVRAAWNRRE
jgi:lysophospholipid acyltransferase (LPLAT)-like uncharacterized protein